MKSVYSFLGFGVGDGTSANGFHPTNPDILFASFQSQFFFTHFHRGSGGIGAWVWTSAPIASPLSLAAHPSEELPTVLTPNLQILPDRRLLFAGTHGRGAWYLTLA